MSAAINSSAPSPTQPHQVDGRAPTTTTAPAARDQQRFDRALERAAERRSNSKPGSAESDEEPKADAQPAVAAAALPSSSSLGSEDVSTADGLAPWAQAAPAFAGSLAAEAVAQAPLLSLEQFTAALARLQVPVNTQGAQQWQFSLAPAHGAQGPVVGVQLNTLAAGGPWHVTLQSPARDRQVLHANLDKLRDRLRARGAPVAGVQVGPEQEGDR
jgi:hypothetical protein